MSQLIEGFLQSLTVNVARMAADVEAMAKGGGGGPDPTATLAAAAGPGGAAAGAATKAAASAADSLAKGIATVGGAVEGGIRGAGQVASGDLGGALNAAAGIAAKGLEMLGPAGKVAGAALEAVAGAAGALFDLARQTVGAFSPSTMLVFDQTLRDLSATIGVALEPVIEAATKVLQEFGAYLLPVAEKLRPVFEKLGAAAADIAETVFPLLASIISEVVVPLLQFLADVLKGITGVIKSVFGGLTAPEKKDINGMAVMQNPAFTGFAEFGKQVALAAQKAGGGKVKTDSERLDEIALEMQKLNAGDSQLPRKIGEAVKKGDKAFEGGGPNRPKGRMNDTGGGDW